jgi:hypothetical protein
MTAATIRNPFTAPDSKHEVAKKWFQRHLHKKTPRNPVAPIRPQTAPSTGAAAPDPLPTTLQPSRSRHAQQSDSAPFRPDSGVTRNVNAWLDANANLNVPATPLMEGLSYWQSASMTGDRVPADAQYAVPIMQPHKEGPSTGHSQHVRSFCRRAKKVQVRMPSLLRTVSQRTALRKQTNRQSNSMPVLHMARPAVDSLPDRCMTAVSRRTFENRENTQSLATSARVSQGDSMGSASDAPTYFTGPPPPSYRSRAVSIQSTSSFGCVDGLSPAQRHTNQQRSALRNQGMRGKLRELHQKLKAQHKQQ